MGDKADYGTTLNTDSPVMKVEFFIHALDDTDRSNLDRTLDSVILTTGEEVHRFEQKFSQYTGIEHTVGVTSCTAALHLALLAWGIGTGDEVITTPMTFCATANAILHTGATPVFVDVEPTTGNIDATLIEGKITNKTKAIIPVHLYGQLCDMKAIREIADRHSLVVIEDAAHCVEGSRDSIRVGHLADATCFSFYATKSITAGEGGAISTNCSEKASLLRALRTHGIDKDASARYNQAYQHWDMQHLGWKYNMFNIQAALLIGQIERIEHIRAARERVFREYDERLRGHPHITLMEDLPNSKHGYHLFTIQVAPEIRDRVLTEMHRRKIGVAVNYRSVHLLTYYKETFMFESGSFPVAERIGNSTISLPLHTKLSTDQIDYVVSSIEEVLSQLIKESPG